MLDLISMCAFSRLMHMLCECGLDGYIYVEYNAKLCMCIVCTVSVLHLVYYFHIYKCSMFTVACLPSNHFVRYNSVYYILNCVALH